MSIIEEGIVTHEEANVESVSIEIENMLSCRSRQFSKKFSILRVPDQLRHVNSDAYEPQMISIGPYNYNNNKTYHMEEHKKEYLTSLLQRTGHDVSKYVNAMKNLVEEAKQCYEVYNDLEIWKDNNKFVKMLVLDGCFIIELIRKVEDKKLRNENDPVFMVELNEQSILRDILLLENQLPLFLLSKLYEETASSPRQKKFQDLLRPYRIGRYPSYVVETPTIEESKHLLDFMHKLWRPPPRKNENMFMILHIPCVTELRKSGINIKEASFKNMFDLRFDNGTLIIPPLDIFHDADKSLMQNLIAYEQAALNNDQNCYVTDYLFMMHWLIRSTQDANFLYDKRLFYHDKVITPKTFEKFVENATLSLFYFYYSDVVEQIIRYCSRRRTALVAKWNLWREELWVTYFKSPWAFISFLAACIFLLLTVVQTYCSVKSPNR